MVSAPGAPEITPARMRKLTAHAAALNTYPEAALDALLDQPPLPRRNSKRRWTPEELKQVANLKNSPRSLARELGRTPTAISNKRNEMQAANREN